MTTSAQKLYFTIPIAALLAALLTFDLVESDPSDSAAGPATLACRTSQTGPQIGALVSYSVDGMTYRVIGRLPETVLIQRGDEQIYANMSEIALTGR